MTEGGIRRRLVRDTAWYGVSAALAKALALLTVPILTRTLGPEGYGLVDLGTSTAALLTLVAMLSADIPATGLDALAEDPAARLRTISSYVWVVAIVSVLVAAVLLPLSSLWWPGDHHEGGRRGWKRGRLAGPATRLRDRSRAGIRDPGA